jgi:hypothetical protein
MPLKSFKIANQKAITFAECTNVPKIMVIAGPNGVGKSTLLYCLKSRQCTQLEISGKVLYIPPHRAWRKQQIRYQSLWNPRRPYSEVLESTQLQGVEGIRLFETARVPDSADESMSLVKYTLAQVEARRSKAITTRVDRNNLVYPEGKVPDVYRPLKDLTKSLLPHLEFSKIGDFDQNNVRIFWKRSKGFDFSSGVLNEIDIDELSSGEKSIISLFLPFIEKQMDQILQELETGQTNTITLQDMVVLIDEPELHLHPALQVRLLDYLRNIVAQGNVQFIITTHSSTLLNASTNDELYILTPKPDWPEPSNQLIQMATDADRLEGMRILCGETYPITACRAIVCIEGEVSEDLPSKPPDKQILSMICPELSEVVTLPLGGKNIVIQGAKRLKEILPSGIPGLNVFAIVDRDQNKRNRLSEDFIFELPVCMLENFLLIPDAINAVLKPYIERIKLKNSQEIESALKTIARNLKNDEIRLRVQHKIKPVYEHINGISSSAIKEKRDEIIESIKKTFPTDEELEQIVTEATSEVEEILRNNEELRFFRGKEILNGFFKQYLRDTKLSYMTFCIDLSKEVAKCPSATQELQKIIKHILGYVPKEISNELEEIKKQINSTNLISVESKKPLCEEIDSLLSQCDKVFAERRDNKAPIINRISLRNSILNLARKIEESFGGGIDTIPELKRYLEDLRFFAQKIGTLNT